MNSFLSRANSVFAFSLSVTAALTFACFLTTNFLDYGEKVEIKVSDAIVRNIEDFNAHRQKNDLGSLSFDLKADLTPVFNWNLKQLFLYLLAEYETKNNKVNQVVLWDKIIMRGQNAKIDLKNMHTLYYFFDDGHGLKGNQNVTITLRWNLVPNAGYLGLVTGTGNHQFAFPKTYASSRRQ
ncbi:signal peptidase complex subunit 3-like [Styela clava]|uniref:signal peptidase complex subunit 3-like n=1 Tax=Styela clava TaxID=7725 RepID=UPI0019397077|nr:signal peptidase complex subunit 3-like [Styela clava]